VLMWEMVKSKWLCVSPGWRKYLLGLTLIGVIFISGCTTLYDPETAQEFNAQIIGTVSPGHPIGQTFISRRASLNGITLWLEPNGSNADLILDLYHSPADTNPIFHTSVKPHSGDNYIAIRPQPDPPNQGYFIQLSSAGAEIQVYGRDEEIYPLGSILENGQPGQGDLAFRATYEYDYRSAISDLQAIIKGSWLVIPVLILLFIPGWLILDFTGYRKEYDYGEQIAISIGLSTALVPVLMLWTTTFGMEWRQRPVWVAGVIISLIFLIRLVWNYRSTEPTSNRPSIHGESILNLLALLVIFSVATFIRFAMARDLAAPAWVDSIHHSLITQAIIEYGGYPENYLPHIPVEASQYHPGYHSLIATFQWLTSLQIPESMLIFGQVLNGLMVFPVYLLGTTLLKDKKASLIAALVTGLLVLMPAYYTSWGRYTQLAGLLVLPAGFRWITRFSKFPLKIKYILPGGILLAGLFLLHYRVLIFLGCLFLAAWIGNLFRPKTHPIRKTLSMVGSTGLFGIAGMVIGLPWLLPILSQYVIPRALHWRGNPVLSGIHWNYLTPVLGIPVMILAGLGLVMGIYQKRRFAIKILVWLMILFGIANPGYFHLPFPGGFVNQTSVEIMVFMPISVLAGYFIYQGISCTRRWTPNRWQWIHTVVVFLLVSSVSIRGAQVLLASLNPATILYRSVDRDAMLWIQENIPEDETIVINPTGWGYGLYMGNDGGFWISPLTGRASIPPNVLYGQNKEKRDLTNQFVEALLPIGEDADKVFELLQEYGYRTIYIGGRGGVISPQSLSESPHFKARYHNQNTWIFEILKKP